MSWITGVGLTPFGRHEGHDTVDLMSTAAALDDAGLARGEIDGLITGYSTTMPHLMLSTLFAEHFGLSPAYAHGIQLGGATGYATVMLAHLLVGAGLLRHILVVAGENRLTGQSRDAAMQTLAQVGYARYEMLLGPTIPAYYGLLASRYMHDTGTTEADVAALAVLMRDNAATHPGAQFRERMTVADVLALWPIAEPLRILDCCPVSDGGAAIVISRERTGAARVRIRGTGQAHSHQHISAAPSFGPFGAALAASRAGLGDTVALSDVRYAGVYDSFTITLAILLEELGLAPRGRAGRLAAASHFGRDGDMPLNTHGGLLSYGHCGVAGAMAHLVETQLQMTGRARPRQVRDASVALLHGDGGVLSSHVTLWVEQTA